MSEARRRPIPPPASPAVPPFPAELGRVDSSVGNYTELAGEEVAALSRKVDSLAALVMAQNAVLERVAGILSEQRVSRTQETAIKRAIQARAKALALREGLKGHYDPDASVYWDPERHLGEAIRKTLRELTGARAIGDIRAGVYDAAMRHIMEWDYPGAIRRIRREAGQ